MTLAIVSGGVADLDEMLLSMDAFDASWGEAWTRAQCQGLFGLPGTHLLLARVSGLSAGFALARTILDDAELLLLAVRPDYRRRGIGRMLIEHVARAAAAAGAHRLHLEVRAGNDARGLYEQAGFVTTGRRRGYYRQVGGGTADALTLARPLQTSDGVPI